MEKLSIKDLGIKWGLILGLILIIYGIILQMMGLGADQALGMVSYIFVAGGLFVAYRDFKAANSGFMEFGEGFKIGGIATVIYSLVSSVFMYVYIIMIDDSMIEMIKDQQYEEMEKQNLSEEQIDAAMEMAGAFMTPEMISIMGFVFTVFFGVILTLIMSAILKKSKPELG